jgi:NADH dehydrogenase [ubiquinone] 1 alpha subcomplex assembly factor 7
MVGTGEHPTGLRERLLARIRREGPITFAAFMEAALYDPEEGFYAGLPIGPDADFVTSPHISRAFGALLARQLGECWDLLGRPAPFRVVEVGAGDGTLARRILADAGAVPELAAVLRYEVVERSGAARAALAADGMEVRERLAGAGPAHVVLANELLDNLPFHRLRERDGGVVEVLVGAEKERLVEVEARPTPEALAVLGAPLRPGEERPVSPAALSLLGEVASILRPGYAFLFDYGFERGERPTEVQAFLGHRVTGDLLSDPGTRDLTASVDLMALGRAAERNGLTVWGPVTQREALLGLGMRLWIQGVRRAQQDAEAREDHREAARLYSERSRASILVDDSKLGGLRLLVLGSEGLPAPAAALGDRESGC